MRGRVTPITAGHLRCLPLSGQPGEDTPIDPIEVFRAHRSVKFVGGARLTARGSSIVIAVLRPHEVGAQHRNLIEDRLRLGQDLRH